MHDAVKDLKTLDLEILDLKTPEKLARLRSSLEGCGRLAIAFSGGVDSTFLLQFAREVLGERVVAFTALAPNFAADEIEEARDFCRSQGIRHVLLNLGGDFLDTLSQNTPDRCYHCKKRIFGDLLASIKGDPALQDALLADGTNADDASDFRPGTKALAELGIKSPLKEVGLTKAEIRAELKARGLPVWDKPAFACLASRIPYGEAITAEKLGAVYALEKALRERGFLQVRVRHHGEVARIEVLPEDRTKFFDTALMDQIHQAAREAGFVYAALDLAGYKMGNMNVNAHPRL